MSTRTKIVLLLVAVVLLALRIIYSPGCASCAPKAVTPTATSTLPTMHLGDTTLSAIIVDTEALREQGLSGRDGLPPDTGMLFVFDTPGVYTFWMKDMKFDLDMIWIDKDKRIVGISKDVKASSYPESFPPPGPILYVVEVSSGYSDAKGIKVGEKLSIGQ